MPTRLSKREEQGIHGATRVKFFVVTWGKVQRESPLEEGCSLICVPSISEACNCCGDEPTWET